MKTTRFETFFDAVLAIIITVLVLKIAQPTTPTLAAMGNLTNSYLTYLTCFLIIFNIWHGNHNLLQLIDEIDNLTLIYYGLLIFSLSLLPYFSVWLSLNVNSIPAQTAFGTLFIITHILYLLSTNSINKLNPKHSLIDFKNKNTYISLIIILIGFILTYTVYTQAIFICCIISIIYSILTHRAITHEIKDSGRFEAFIDAIVAIILTIIVLELTMANGGSWEALFDLKFEFITYIISFLVCFNYWIYNTNLFHLVKKIDYKVIWTIGFSLFVFSLIPYLTHFVANNFYYFLPQALYGIDFLLITIIGIILGTLLKKLDSENIELKNVFNLKAYISSFAIILIGFIIGYLYYSPAITLACLISIPITWIFSYFEL